MKRKITLKIDSELDTFDQKKIEILSKKSRGLITFHFDRQSRNFRQSPQRIHCHSKKIQLMFFLQYLSKPCKIARVECDERIQTARLSMLMNKVISFSKEYAKKKIF